MSNTPDNEHPDEDGWGAEDVLGGKKREREGGSGSDLTLGGGSDLNFDSDLKLGGSDIKLGDSGLSLDRGDSNSSGDGGDFDYLPPDDEDSLTPLDETPSTDETEGGDVGGDRWWDLDDGGEGDGGEGDGGDSDGGGGGGNDESDDGGVESSHLGFGIYNRQLVAPGSEATDPEEGNWGRTIDSKIGEMWGKTKKAFNRTVNNYKSITPWDGGTHRIVPTDLQKASSVLVCGDPDNNDIGTDECYAHIDRNVASLIAESPSDTDEERLRGAMLDFVPCVGGIGNFANTLVKHGSVGRTKNEDDIVNTSFTEMEEAIERLINNYIEYVNPNLPEGNPSSVDTDVECNVLDERLQWLEEVLNGFTSTWWLYLSQAHKGAKTNLKDRMKSQEKIAALVHKIESLRWEIEQSRKGDWEESAVRSHRAENTRGTREKAARNWEKIMVVHRGVKHAIWVVTLGTVVALKTIFGGDGDGKSEENDKTSTEKVHTNPEIDANRITRDQIDPNDPWGHLEDDSSVIQK
jgi:hypothetical protein